jgi:hypothetical protein
VAFSSASAAIGVFGEKMPTIPHILMFLLDTTRPVFQSLSLVLGRTTLSSEAVTE